MSTTAGVVYNTKRKIVLAALSERDERRREWAYKLKGLGSEAFGIPIDDVDFLYGFTFAGFSAAKVDTMDPTIWRHLAKDTRCLVPNRKSKEGRQWAKRLEPLSHRPDVEIPGAKGIVMASNPAGDMSIYHPNVGMIGSTAWCRWGSRPGPECMDLGIWTERPMSSFYRAAEKAGIDT